MTDLAVRAALREITLVVIGGSAGSFEALRELLPALPATCPPVLVVIHQPERGPSLLAELFAPRCAARARDAADKLPLDAGTISFAVPGYHLMVERNRTMSLSTDAPVMYARPAIDVLFETAAWANGRRTLGVLLSGANEDGAAGLAEIKKRGGQTWVQDPAEATSPVMPEAGRRIGPSLVAPVRALAAHLRAWPAEEP